jgi:hypothetical protein
MFNAYVASGKQVLYDGKHFADANSNDAAALIADAMNQHDASSDDDPVMPELRSDGMVHSIRREGDEHVCRCGIRWGTDEGDEHP